MSTFARSGRLSSICRRGINCVTRSSSVSFSPKQLGVLLTIERRIREQELRRATLDDRPQQVLRREVVNRLRRQDHGGVALPPGLQRFLDVRAQPVVLNEPPRFVHHTELQARRVPRLCEARSDPVQHVEQERLEQRRVLAHRLEVEHLERMNTEGVVDVIEERRVPAALHPFAQPACQGAREHVGEGEEPALTPIEHVEVFNRLVELAVLRIRKTVAVRAFEQHAGERVEEVQVLWRRLERERIDRQAVLAEPELEIAPVEERGQLPVAVAEIEDDRERVVLLRMHRQEVEQEALAAPGRAEHEGVANVLDVQMEMIGGVVTRFERGEGFRPEKRAGGLRPGRR